jgi:antitoxin component of MazEF toxin-antitoxin module
MLLVRIVRHGNSHALTLPRALLAELSWVPGETLCLATAGGELHVAKFEYQPDSFRPKGVRRGKTKAALART